MSPLTRIECLACGLEELRLELQDTIVRLQELTWDRSWRMVVDRLRCVDLDSLTPALQDVLSIVDALQEAGGGAR